MKQKQKKVRSTMWLIITIDILTQTWQILVRFPNPLALPRASESENLTRQIQKIGLTGASANKHRETNEQANKKVL